MTDERMRDLAELVLEVTEPAESPQRLGIMAVAMPHLLTSLGLLQRCRKTVRAMCSLVDAKLEGVGAPLARSTLEDSVTGIWLMKKPKERFPMMLTSYNRHLAQLEEAKPGVFDTQRELLDSMLTSLSLSPTDKGDLPPLEQRMDELVGEYWEYRVLSLRTHPSFEASLVPFYADEHTKMIGMAPEDAIDALASDYLFVCCNWTLALAVAYQTATNDEGPSGKLLAACMALHRFDSDSDAPLLEQLFARDE
ncbi:MAG: hypothetical protein GEU71_11900 [Actinobacteria bacterium]|nr:hypothetical protein [Actinomycetota bacterium]